MIKFPRVQKLFEVDQASLRPNRIDKTSSFLMATMIVTASLVVVLAILVSGGTEITKAKPETDKFGDGLRSGGHRATLDSELDLPDSDEVIALTEPSIDQSLSTIGVLLDQAIEGFESENGKLGKPGFEGVGGEGRRPGPAGHGIPPSQRWELKFQATDIKSYAVQLDSFGIELLAIGGGIANVEYAKHLSAQPVMYSGLSKDENRILFSVTRDGVLARYDSKLLERAGIRTQGRVVLKCIPKNLEETLLQSEIKYYEERSGKAWSDDNVLRTVFECRPCAKHPGFEWVIIDQRSRAEFSAFRSHKTGSVRPFPF